MSTPTILASTCFLLNGQLRDPLVGLSEIFTLKIILFDSTTMHLQYYFVRKEFTSSISSLRLTRIHDHLVNLPFLHLESHVEMFRGTF
jgi:hypothetical protein